MEVKYRAGDVLSPHPGPHTPVPAPLWLTGVVSRKTSKSGDKKVWKPVLCYYLRSLLTARPPPKLCSSWKPLRPQDSPSRAAVKPRQWTW